MNENIGRLNSPYVFLIRSSFFLLMIELFEFINECRHNGARILNRQTTRVVTEVSEFLEVGSTPTVSSPLHTKIQKTLI